MARLTALAADARWYVYDGLGSVLAEVDVNGVAQGTRKYDVYGATRSYTGTPVGRQAFVGQLGHATDDETGLTYMRARYYDNVIGRFVSQDTAGQGANWYTYCANDPVNCLDEDGKQQASAWERIAWGWVRILTSQALFGAGLLLAMICMANVLWPSESRRNYMMAMANASAASLLFGLSLIVVDGAVPSAVFDVLCSALYGGSYQALIQSITNSLEVSKESAAGFAFVALAALTVNTLETIGGLLSVDYAQMTGG